MRHALRDGDAAKTAVSCLLGLRFEDLEIGWYSVAE
jgi:hypothetical protein